MSFGPIWRTAARSLTGDKGLGGFDPGIGRGRYHRALEWLREVDRPLGFASFTFDPDIAGSVVIAPDSTGEYRFIAGAGPPPALRVVDDGRAEWAAGFATAMREVEGGNLRKVVLARQVELEADGPLDVRSIIEKLSQANPTANVFHIEGLIGASPELLISVQGEDVTSLVLAGTAAGPEGLENDRIELEHDLAVESVANALAGHATVITREKSVLEVGRISHLATRFEAIGGRETDVMAILADLHPTAAVAGTPTNTAVDLIRRIEPRSRGRYAGPVGWFDQDGNGEFAIALRCGLIRGRRVTLFSGGGLVAGADMDSEWSETEAKLEPMLQALGAMRTKS